MTTKVKICGITRLEDAELAVGAAAPGRSGMIFHPDSPRRCEPETAAEIATALQAPAARSPACS